MAPKRKTKEEFLNQCIDVHGDLYDYSLIDYIDSRTKIKIKCSIHGVFEQDPYHHLEGRGCKKCGMKNCTILQPKKNSDFIKHAIEIHKDKYDYSLVYYKNNYTKIKIKCKIHGLFEQTPVNHIFNKQGCNKCNIESKYKDTETFIKDATNVHGNLYNYSRSIYVDRDTKVIIICKIHGEFEQAAGSHTSGVGCPYCFNKTEGKVKEFLSEKGIEFKARCIVDNKRFDFLVNEDFILEIDGRQHFPKTEYKFIVEIDREANLNNDIQKMISIIDYYPVVRLFQENLWSNKYDWKTLIQSCSNLEPGILYIRLEEKGLYEQHSTKLYDQYQIETKYLDI